MSNFEKIYHRSVGFRSVSLPLKPLLKQFYCALITRPINQPAIKRSIEALLLFLTTAQGRTDANVQAVSLFVSIDDDWENDWLELPPPLVEIISDIGGALHDSVSASDMAEEFDSTPEQLLQRIQRLP